MIELALYQGGKRLTSRMALNCNNIALEHALKSIGVERQAYYSGTFIGNHVHKCLQVISSTHIYIYPRKENVT